MSLIVLLLSTIVSIWLSTCLYTIYDIQNIQECIDTNSNNNIKNNNIKNGNNIIFQSLYI